MAKPFDIHILNNTAISAVNEVFKELCHADPTAEPVITEKEIIEYDSRMRVMPMEKFNGLAYAGVINYYLSQKDLDTGLAVGTFIFIIKEEYAEKLIRAMGRVKVDMDNEDAVRESLGEFGKALAQKIKDAVVSNSYADLLISTPLIYKNVVPEGAQFDYNLYKKQELIFSFWNKQCVVVEVCMGNVPQRAR